LKRARGRLVGEAAMLQVCFATRVLADWALVMPPRTTNTDCTITYREDLPVQEWSGGHFVAKTREECERIRTELARRQAGPRPQPFSRWDWGGASELGDEVVLRSVHVGGM
jgi:hypothetical protein